MKINKALRAASLILLSSLGAFSASAEVINTDWLMEGDNLVISDLDTGLEFLSLNATVNMSYNQVAALLDTTYAGWSFATGEDVTSLLENLLEDYGGYSTVASINIYDIYITEVNDILGGYDIGNSYYSLGYIGGEGNVTTVYGVISSTTGYKSNNNYAHTSYTKDVVSNQKGVWLVRDTTYDLDAPDDTDSVSDAPVPLALASLGLLGLGFARRQKRATK